MLKICLVFWKSEPQYAYKLYAYKKKHVVLKDLEVHTGGSFMTSDSNLDSTHVQQLVNITAKQV